MKYGFAGRVLLGPKGRPGPITLPLKVHVTDKSRNRVATHSACHRASALARVPIRSVFVFDIDARLRERLIVRGHENDVLAQTLNQSVT